MIIEIEELWKDLLPEVVKAYNQEADNNYYSGELDFIPKHIDQAGIVNLALLHYVMQEYPELLEQRLQGAERDPSRDTPL